MKHQLGLLLTGGGARGSYQAGVVLGLAEVFKELGVSEKFPISSFSGVSAGALNVSYLSSAKVDFFESATQLCQLWSGLKPQMVYRTDVVSIGRIGFGWLRDATFGAAFKRKAANELLDNGPLIDFINKNIDFEQIRKNVDEGFLKGVACTAFDYRLKKSVSFLHAHPEVEAWERSNRLAQRVKLNSQYVLASCAIPIIFPPVKIGESYFGDGSLRNTAPVSSIIHLGAEKIIFVGVRYLHKEAPRENLSTKPSVAEIFGTILNGLFFDTTDIDIERMNSINLTLDHLPFVHQKGHPMKKLSSFVIRPSVDIARLAMDMAPKSLPPLIDYLLRGLGDRSEYGELASYLLFDSSFTSQLIALGREDVNRQKKELVEWLEN